MKSEYSSNVEYASDGVQTSGFNIAVNSTMFQMLTSNIYNNPKLAVIREWSTNACDACIAAEKDVVYDVHLPTTEDPTFYVRDYGTGLSPEDIIGLFSTLGESTKRNSDSLNGCFGIGRMAGLAVSEAFTVESFYKGQHHSYVVSVDDGTPVTMHFGSTPTEEPDGLKLSVSVAVTDVPIFSSLAEKLYRYFDYKPNLNIELDISTREGLFRNDSWYLSKDKNNGYGSNSNKVVLSQVVYDIPHSNEIDTKRFSNIVIKAPPGSVTFNPGRESLSLDKKTIKFLNDMFTTIEKEFAEQAKEVLELTTSDKEAVQTYYKMRYASWVDLLPTAYLTNVVSDCFKNFLPDGSLNVYPSKDFEIDTKGLLTIWYKDNYRKGSREVEKYYSLSASAFVDAVHVIVDVKTNFKTGIFNHYYGKSIVLWQRTKKSDIDLAKREAERYLDSMGIEYEYASNIVSNTTKSATEQRKGLYASKINNGNVYKSSSMTHEEATKETYLYVKLSNTTPQLNDKNIKFSEYCYVYRVISNLKSVPKIYGVAKKYQDYVNTLDNWIDFEDWIKEECSKLEFYTDTSVTFPTKNINDFPTKYLVGYPEDFKALCIKIKNYLSYIRSNTNKTVLPKSYSDLGTLTALGADIKPFNPWTFDEVNHIAKKYPVTIDLINTGKFYHESSQEQLASVAQLEEKYYETLKTM